MEIIIYTFIIIMALLMVMPINHEVCDMSDEELDTFAGLDASEM